VSTRGRTARGHTVSRARGRTMRSPTPGQPHWAQVGDRVISWTTAGHRSGTPDERAGDLFLVTQVGRAFQDEHPEVRPVLDHGRHLVVEHLDPSLVTATTCWRAEALPENQVVVDVPQVQAARRRDPATDELLSSLSPATYDDDVTWLASLPTRHSTSGGFMQAADWAATRLAATGCDVTRMPVPVGAGQSQNVIGDRPAPGEAAADLVIVTAHLDSVNAAGGPSAPAPGADDNASGCAGVLALAEALGARTWASDLRLVLFGGEEQGLIGSTRYVASLPTAERQRVRAVLNMDMIATRNTPTPAVLIEGAAVSTALIDDLVAAAGTYTALRVETSLSPFASDHVPFIDAGMPALLTIEGADSANGNVHTAQDTLDHLDHGLALEILRMNLAALAGWLGPAMSSPRPAGSVVARAAGRLDVFALGPGGTMLHKSWDGERWLPGVTEYADLGRPPVG